MRTMAILFFALVAALFASCDGDSPATDGGLDAASDTDIDTDADADADSDTDTDTDADASADASSDADTDTDTDTDTDADCEGSGYTCAIIGTCSGTTVSATGCELWEECCDPGDAGAPCPWSCEGYPTPVTSGCEGIGHTNYDCGMTEVCCEPAAVDAGTGTCESPHHCENIWSGCGDDSIHFELSGCSLTQICCD